MNPVLSADLHYSRHVRSSGFSEFLGAARKELLEARRSDANQHARRLIANVLERVNDAARHVSCATGADFMPFASRKKCNSSFEDMKCFVLIHVMMRRRPTAGRCDLRPHRKLSACPLAIQENRHFLAKRVQHGRVIPPDYGP